MTTTQQGLAERIRAVEQRIQAACDRSGRSRQDINVIAVTKYVSLDTARQAVEEGCTHVGENRWQDAKEKWEAIGGAATWHFIGHLQTNKVKDVLGKFAYIHSLDRISLAEELQKKAAASGVTANCFIQVNVSGEESKYGLAPDKLLSFVEEIKTMSALRIVGLMTMAPYEDAEATRPVFRGLRELRDRLNRSGMLAYEVPHLSMGMSNDFEIAIEEGATWVRLGSILVGKE
ncbi:YggS family pyridoxal phosphate-dependent enzyme [Paenibacillus sp. y28]|uniref:YggS family pyridoxal phosphate-dependent enzyme n=1 Tax=Paenibacillus sp. y28 TaxID=3129110 RepID=UPI0030199EC0